MLTAYDYPQHEDYNLVVSDASTNTSIAGKVLNFNAFLYLVALNPLGAKFFIPFRTTEIIFYKSLPGIEFFPMFTVWHGLFSLIYSCFSGEN